MGPKLPPKKRKKTRYLSLRRRIAASTLSATTSPPPSEDVAGNGDSASQPPCDDVSVDAGIDADRIPSTDEAHHDELHHRSPSRDVDGGRDTLMMADELDEDELARFFPADDDGAVSFLSLLGSPDAAADSCSSSSSVNVVPPRSAASSHLSLKLDYDGVLSAWPALSPFYVISDDTCQVVPDLHLTGFHSPVFVDVPGCESATWAVPDKTAREEREARVLRYKEKRRRRLYNKRIRYEVRKVNAEKRPRIKGRFVRRDDDG